MLKGVLRTLLGLVLFSLLAPAPAAYHIPATAVLAASAAHRPRLQIINADLDFRPKVRPIQGKLRGYDPAVATVRVGDRVQFVNTDDSIHTATGFAVGGQTVPKNYRFAGDPTKRSGSQLDAREWSSGVLRSHGGKSQILTAKTVGIFYFGCAYHLGDGMRGAIVVKP